MNAARRNEIINAIRDLTNRIDSLDRRNLVEFKKVNGQVSTLETRIDVRMDELESHAAKEVASFGARIDGVATAFKQVNPDPAVVGTEFIREGGRGGPERCGRWCEHCVGLWKRTTRGLTFSGT